MAEQPKYWKAIEERDNPELLSGDEFRESPRQIVGRRDFLKAAGFSVALAAATGCSRAPVQKAMPLLNQPETIVPGRALFYASTCGGCSAGCGVLVKVRDGRPIKLEGNPEHPLSRGGLCAVGQASILGLYDSQRLEGPYKRGKLSKWEEIDAEIVDKLKELSGSGGVRLLSQTITSPTVQATITTFLSAFSDARHVVYDSLSHSAILDAHAQTHGVRLMPQYRFDHADVIVAFDADFLGTFVSPVQFTGQHRDSRDLETQRVAHHVQFESRMSLTGSKADVRYAVHPEEVGYLLSQLATRIASRAGKSFGSAHGDQRLDDVAERLWAARGRGIVVSGSNDVREQVLVNYVNHLLGNYEHTVLLEESTFQAAGSDANTQTLITELENGKVAALFVLGANPVYDLPNGSALGDALKRVPLVVSFAQRMDETARASHYVCPDHHFLESWADAEAVNGTVAVQQPALNPIRGTRAAMESMATWAGTTATAYDIVRDHWRAHVFPRQKKFSDFETFWDQTVHDGCARVTPLPANAKPFNERVVTGISRAPVGATTAVVLYPKLAMLDGRHAYNPWLHELPDPISKVAWDNYASISPSMAEKLGISQSDVVRVATERGALELPAYIQPGQHGQVIAVALGYGSVLSARFANIGPQWLEARSTVGDNGCVGQNAASLARIADGVLTYSAPATLTRTGTRRELACTQLHNTLTVPPKLAPPDSEPRPIVQETTLAAFLKNPRAGVEDHVEKEDLWPTDHPYTGPRWGMVIDLNACTGCSACVIACQAENNIPVVGYDEMRRNREMHWLRIDRYYSEPAPEVLEVAYQPLPCQQCENAPCETVCPVLATVHTDDGLNAQVYNRCVGTRYCANNCPYKGRRFNWFNYSRNDDLQNLQLNPDVTVRSRGVMEKCTFCVQRIQLGKIEAKTRGERIHDGDVQTACQQSCPARAIYFGDLNDADSAISREMNDPRRYRLLSELNVKPAVGYLTVVRNRDEFKEGSNG